MRLDDDYFFSFFTGVSLQNLLNILDRKRSNFDMFLHIIYSILLE